MMEPLKPEFREMLGSILGKEDASGLCDALDREASVGVRLNPRKCSAATKGLNVTGVPAWCRETGLLLGSRPQFALMPTWHGGALYVQEPASMVMSAVAEAVAGRQSGVRWLDLCAAPGGKTTAVLAALPDDAFVVANEFDPRRASVLAENVAKWGAPNVALTRGDTTWVRKMRESFDVVAVDAPCSGEGMMRKEAAARSQWSAGLVEQCASLQREILANAWEALRPGGLLIYSTCTFNRQENEDNVRFMMENFGAKSEDMLPELKRYGVRGSLDADIHALRFMPHATEGEGLFVALLSKPGETSELVGRPAQRRKGKIGSSGKKGGKNQSFEVAGWLTETERFAFETNREGIISAIPAIHEDFVKDINRACPSVITAGVKVATIKGRDLIPTPELALSTALSEEAFPRVELTEEEALDYLRRGTSGAMTAIQRAGLQKRGYAVVTFDSLPLGFVKNLGNRINNLYPASWRLRMG